MQVICLIRSVLSVRGMTMKIIKNLIFLLLFFSLMAFAPAAFAAGKRGWTFDYKKWNLPEYGMQVRDRNKWETMGGYDKPNPYYEVDFTPDNIIFISFLEYKYQPQLGSKAQPEKMVVLLLSREKGKLIKRIEWPVITDYGNRTRSFYRIYPLPSGGYIALINGRLQALDSSFSVIHERVLDATENSYTVTVQWVSQNEVIRRV